MCSYETYKDNMKQLQEIWDASLRKHHAVDMIAGHEFVGYIIQEEDGFSVDIWCWGVNHGKVFRGKNLEELSQKCYEYYDL